MKIVISIGGSIIAPLNLDVEYIKRFSGFVKELSERHSVGIVVGGGRIARDYISVSRSFGASEFFSDLIGIEASRLNAMLLTASLHGIGVRVNKKPALTIEGAAREMGHHGAAVMGGTHPGHTTDGVAAMLAEYTGADLLINATSIDGVYTADPKKDPGAEKIERLNFDELIEIVGRGEATAGRSTIIDLVAAKVMKRSRIRTCVLDGRDLENMRDAVSGKKFVGSVIE
ncbi:MAG: hypothetical protein A7316_06600 [Candidatus Altiarchaeales archaeon WOR_SM1_86-2]|nr:MAG: hypothetical protein A7315_13175 [Candidatus Altiarchaeales archaeon WOR_SM1_79]ODS38960.1 MAG: hypothetical protein A7316_06600 [Candidatus Altiarchaeales archaeon WOR_SM1_86-2]